MLDSIHLIGEFKGRQNLYQAQSPHILERLVQSARVESVESSNRIEGITIPGDRLSAIVNQKSVPQGRSEEEVAGYRDALAEIHINSRSIEVKPAAIRWLHKILLGHTPEKGGEWKSTDNAILETRPDGRQVVRFQTVSAVATGQFMEDLCQHYQSCLQERKGMPLMASATMVFDFLCVHPFRDGNGRVGRLLTLLSLYQCGYEVGRYISLERIIESSKETYYEALNQSSKGWHESRHDLRPWWNYYLGVLVSAYKEFEERAGYLLQARGAKTEMIIQAVKRLPDRFTFQQVSHASAGISPDLVRKVLRNLQREGKISCIGFGPGALWQKEGTFFD